MRFVRLKKHHVEFFKLIFKLIHFIVRKCWLQFASLASVIFLIYYLFGIIIAFLITFGGLLLVLHRAVDSFLYYPDDPPDSRVNVFPPSAVGLPAQAVFVKTPDNVEINLVLIKQNADKFATAPTVVYFHGNAGNIGHRLVNVKELHHSCGCNVLLVEYRGYGLSKGSPSESGLYLDAEAAMKYILGHPGIDKSKIVLYGRSLGGAVAIDLARNSKFSSHVSAVIVENTFTSIPEVARVLFNVRFVRLLPNWFYRSRFDSITKIKQLSVPILFLSGLMDELIPPAMMRGLFQACGSAVKHFHSFESGTHNYTWHCKNYYALINSFLTKVFSGEAAFKANSLGNEHISDEFSREPLAADGTLSIPSVLAPFKAGPHLNTQMNIFEMERSVETV